MSDREFNRREPLIADRGEPLGTGVGGAVDVDLVGVNNAAQPERPQSGQWLWKVLILLLLLGLAAVSGFAWQQSQAQAELLARFDELATKISSTDESLNQSGAAIAVALKEQGAELDKHWAEIKKLWVLGNETNRRALTENKVGLDNIKTNLDAHKASIDNLGQAVKEVDQATNALKARLDTELKRIDVASSSALAAAAQADDLNGRVKAVSEKLNVLDKSVRETQASLSTRVTENEQAIRSIDSFRRQMNQQMQEIRQRPAGPGP